MGLVKVLTAVLLLAYLSGCDAAQPGRVVITFVLSSANYMKAPWPTDVASLIKMYGRRMVFKMADVSDENIELLRRAFPAKDVVSIEPDMVLSNQQFASRIEDENYDIGGEGVDSVIADQVDKQLPWHLSDLERFGVHVEKVWDVTKGSAGVEVAVLDTGLALEAKTLFSSLEGGYDFVFDEEESLDGDGRDDDSTDPGDRDPVLCPVSSWHGTKVASVIASRHDLFNARGIAPGVTIVPVRVLGRCRSGYASDLADAIVWAAGGRIDDLDPAHVVGPGCEIISMSLAGLGKCPSYLQSSIDFAVKAGRLVIAAAGNNNGDDSVKYFPGNCNGVLTVAATSRLDGGYTSYSNRGVNAVALAPGGDVNGYIATVSVAFDQLGAQYLVDSLNSGTSFAAPLVAGAAGLVWSEVSDVTGSELKQLVSGVLNVYTAMWNGYNVTRNSKGNGPFPSSGQVSGDVVCDAGRYCTDFGWYSCPKGAYCPAGSTAKTCCPAGTYNPLTGQSSISACIVVSQGYVASPFGCASYQLTCDWGYYCPWDPVNGAYNQYGCPPGTWCDYRSTSPTPCPAGTYQPNIEACTSAYCFACPGGFYSLSGAAGCNSCPAGSYCPGGGSAPISCVPTVGTYCPEQASAQYQCPAGYYCPAGSTVATQCPAGTYCPAGVGATTPCTWAGYYCPAGSGAHVVCPPGSYCPAGSTVGIQCPVGNYCPGGASAPSQCQWAGYYCPAGSSAQLPCPVGTYLGIVGQTACVQCPAGRYNAGTGATICLNCPAGNFSASAGATICTGCQTGQFQSLVGQTTCWGCTETTCPNGQYLVACNLKSDNYCATCSASLLPANAVWSGGGCNWICNGNNFKNGAVCSPCRTTCDAGFYLTACNGISDATCSSCNNKPANAYYTGSSTAPNGCAWSCNAGYVRDATQSACVGCEPGKYWSGGACISCAAGTYSAVSALTVCTNCADGTYNNGLGFTFCQACVPPVNPGFWLQGCGGASSGSLQQCSNPG